MNRVQEFPLQDPLASRDPMACPEADQAQAGHADLFDTPDPESLRASALRQARWLVEFYRITPQELQAPPLPASAAAAVAEAPPAPLPVKYRHPVTGETWDGVGAHPPWMRKALLQDGYRVVELRVELSEF